MNKLLLNYLLRKKSCTKYYFVWSATPNKVQQKLTLGLPIHAISFQQVVNEATAYYENRVKSGELAKERLNRFKRTMREIVIPFVQELDKDFTELNSIDWEQYITYRKGKNSYQEVGITDTKEMIHLVN